MVDQMRLFLPFPWWLAVVLAWKTASHGETLALLGRQMIPGPDLEVAIAWIDTTKGGKGAKGRPWAMVNLTHVVFREEERHVFTALSHIQAECQIAPHLSTSEFDRQAKFLPPPLNQLTGHSFKVGALNHCASLAVSGKLEASLIGVLGKHSGSRVPLADITVRYLRGSFQTAVLNGTGNATRLL